MSDRYRVRIKVLSQQGTCAAGHRAGDEFFIDRHTPAGLCIFAYSAIDPDIRTLMFGGSYPWAAGTRDTYIGCCPDPVNPVVFEISRVENNRHNEKEEVSR